VDEGKKRGGGQGHERVLVRETREQRTGDKNVRKARDDSKSPTNGTPLSPIKKSMETKDGNVRHDNSKGKGGKVRSERSQ